MRLSQFKARRQRQQRQRRAAQGGAQLRAVAIVALDHLGLQVFEAANQQWTGQRGEIAGAAGKAEQVGGRTAQRQRQRRERQAAQQRQAVRAGQRGEKIVPLFRIDGAVQGHVGDLVVERERGRQRRGEAQFPQRQRAAEQQHPRQGQGDLQRRAGGQRGARAQGAQEPHRA